MPDYICPRCGYKSHIKTYLHKHFMRKKPCTSVKEDIDIKECYYIVLGEKMPRKKTVEKKTTKNALECVGNNEKFNKMRWKCVENAEKFNKMRWKCVGNPPENEYYKNTISGGSKEDLTCNKCGKEFKHHRYLKQHLSRYSCGKEPVAYSKEEVEKVIEKRMAEKMADKDHIIDELKKQIEVLLTKVGNTTYNYTQNNIVIQPFGQENKGYIGDSYVKKLIKNGPFSCIPKLIKEIHFHPEHKENHNVKIPNKKLSLAKIYNGEEWEYRDKNLTIENMSDKAYNLISNHYVAGSNKYMDNFKELYEDKDKNVIRRVQKESEIVILNNQDKEI